MLENKVINSKKTMTFIYVIVGGFATLMWSLSSLNTLDLSDVFQVYTIGIGWQGLVTGIISAKDAKEGKKSEEQKDFTKKMIEERNEFYKRYKDSLDI